MKGRYPTVDDFTCANKSALRYFIMHYLLSHPVQDTATNKMQMEASAKKAAEAAVKEAKPAAASAKKAAFVFDFFQPASKAAEASASPADVDAQKHFCTDCGRALSRKFDAGRCKCGTGPGSGGSHAGTGGSRAGTGGSRAGAGRPRIHPLALEAAGVKTALEGS
jgi:hypothetical protein